MKIQNCDECKFFIWLNPFIKNSKISLPNSKLVKCKKGYKPRFYTPKNGNPYGDYGFKKRCEDFKLKK